MRIVAGHAPQAATAVPRARAQCKLLDMADYFEIADWRARRHNVAINRIRIFQLSPGNKVAELFSWVWNPRHSKQMALLANAVARGRLQFRWIHDRSRARIGEVLFHRAMAAFASDRLRGKYRRPILIQSARDMQRMFRNGTASILRDRAREIRIGLILIARCKIVSLPAFVICDRRLEINVRRYRPDTRSRVRPSQSHNRRGTRSYRRHFPNSEKSRRRRMHGDRAAVRRHCPVWLAPRRVAKRAPSPSAQILAPRWAWQNTQRSAPVGSCVCVCSERLV